MISAMNSALQGLQHNRRNLAQHADHISRWGSSGATVPPTNLAREMVGVLQAWRGFEANLPVLRAADEMLGSLLDVLA